jgi:hypothetical protein
MKSDFAVSTAHKKMDHNGSMVGASASELIAPLK